MRHGILVAGLLLLVSSGAAYAQPASKAATEKALIANENTINEAVAKGGVKTFNSLVAPDAVSADMAGFMKVADFVKVMDQVKIASWHIMNPQVVWIDDKTAVVGTPGRALS